MTARITTVIFDLDGLLSDTERLHREAYRDVLAKFGVPLTDVTYTEHWIRLGRGITDFLRDKEPTLDPGAIRDLKAERYHHLVHSKVQPMPGALELLRLLKGKRVLALASSAYPDAVAAVIDTLDIRPFFKVIASSGNVKRVKPFPDIFLYTAKTLGVAPGECVVLEDAEKGVIAAAEAGMACIAVPNEFTRNNDFSRATRVVPSLDQVTLELLDSL